MGCTHRNDILKKKMSSVSKVGLNRLMKRELGRNRSVMFFGRQDPIKSKKDRTREEGKKLVDILETLGMKKITEGIEKTRRIGIYCREGWDAC